jgi:hypothetical protein
MEPVIFARNGICRQLIYGWNPFMRDVYYRTSTCHLSLMLMMALFVGWPAFCLGRIFGYALRAVLALPVFLLFGYKPAGPSWRLFSDDTDKQPIVLPFVPIQNWPRFRGIRLGLWIPALLLLLLACLSTVVYLLGSSVSMAFTTITGETYPLWAKVMSAAPLLAIIPLIICICLGKSRRAEIKDVISNFKETTLKGICRPVEFR